MARGAVAKGQRPGAIDAHVGRADRDVTVSRWSAFGFGEMARPCGWRGDVADEIAGHYPAGACDCGADPGDETVLHGQGSDGLVWLGRPHDVGDPPGR